MRERARQSSGEPEQDAAEAQKVQTAHHVGAVNFARKRAIKPVVLRKFRAHEGVVQPPRYVPPMFRDMNGLAIWLCYSSFFSRLGGTALAEHYTKILGT